MRFLVDTYCSEEVQKFVSGNIKEDPCMIDVMQFAAELLPEKSKIFNGHIQRLSISKKTLTAR